MKKTTLILLLAMISLLHAGEFRFYTDYASYYDNDRSFVELYFMLPRFSMQRYELPNGDLQGQYLLAVNIYQNEENVYAKTLTIDDVVAKDDTVMSNDYIPEIHSLHLFPGEYTINIMVKDMYSGQVVQKNRALNVRSYDMAQLQISDIEIASYAANTQFKNKFTKLGVYDIVPLANPEFDEYMGTFFTYFEVYKLTQGEPYTFQSSLVDLNGETVLENEAVKSIAPGLYDVIIDYMDIKDIPAGIYDYKVSIKDEASGDIAEMTKHVYMIRETEMDLYMFDEYSLYDEHDLDSIFTILKPLMTQNEINTFKKSYPDGKRHLIIEFWKKRDPDQSTGVNEYYIEIMARINFAYQNYTYLNKGPTSDRGRVLLKYGYPTEVQRQDIGGYVKDHEIWLYEGMRGDIKFVFCDTRGRGLYELIHSNMEGEIFNAKWKDILTAGAKSY